MCMICTSMTLQNNMKAFKHNKMKHQKDRSLAVALGISAVDAIRAVLYKRIIVYKKVAATPVDREREREREREMLQNHACPCGI